MKFKSLKRSSLGVNPLGFCFSITLESLVDVLYRLDFPPYPEPKPRRPNLQAASHQV